MPKTGLRRLKLLKYQKGKKIHVFLRSEAPQKVWPSSKMKTEREGCHARLASLRLVVMALVPFAGVAVRVEDEGDADDKRSKRERRELFCGLSQARLGRGKGLRQQLGEADQNEGSSAQQEDDRDLEVGELVSERQDEDRAHDGGDSRQQVPEQSLETVRADGQQQRNVGGIGLGTQKYKGRELRSISTHSVRPQHEGRKNRSHHVTRGVSYSCQRAKKIKMKKKGPGDGALLREWARRGGNEHNTQRAGGKANDTLTETNFSRKQQPAGLSTTRRPKPNKPA